MSTGAAYGKGIYGAVELSTSMGYAQTQPAVRQTRETPLVYVFCLSVPTRILACHYLCCLCVQVSLFWLECECNFLTGKMQMWPQSQLGSGAVQCIALCEGALLSFLSLSFLSALFGCLLFSLGSLSFFPSLQSPVCDSIISCRFYLPSSIRASMFLTPACLVVDVKRDGRSLYTARPHYVIPEDSHVVHVSLSANLVHTVTSFFWFHFSL